MISSCGIDVNQQSVKMSRIFLLLFSVLKIRSTVLNMLCGKC